MTDVVPNHGPAADDGGADEQSGQGVHNRPSRNCNCQPAEVEGVTPQENLIQVLRVTIGGHDFTRSLTNLLLVH